jgi:FXSXX-COOH protein
MIRVDAMPVHELVHSRDSALASALRRVLRQADNRELPYTAFGNTA